MLRRSGPSLLAIVLLGVACSDGEPPVVIADPVEAEAEAAFLDQLSDLLDDDGALPLDTAVRLFSGTIAPLDGVTPLTLEGGEYAPMVVRRLLADRDALPLDVQEALDRSLGANSVDDSESFDVAGGGPSRVPPSDELSATIASVVDDLEARSGHTLTLPVRVHRVPNTRLFLAQTYMLSGGSRRRCEIDVTAAMYADGPAAALSTLAHELWHCFQFDVLGPSLGGRPSWMIEGQAEWVGEDHAGGTTLVAGRWRRWLGDPGRSLHRRTYDAVGLYAVARQEGVDVHPAMLRMLDASGDDAVAALFGVPAEQAAVVVAQHVVRLTDLGPAWVSEGPGIVDVAPPATLDLKVGPVTRRSSDVGGFAALPLRIAVPEGDVARLSVEEGTGVVQLPGGPEVTLGEGESAWWCLRPEGCECPDGSSPAGDATPATAGTGAAGLARTTTGPLGLNGRMFTLEELCSTSIVGTWEVPYDRLRDAIGAAPGAISANCVGDYRLTFTIELTFAFESSATCGSGDDALTIDANSRGTYVAVDGKLTMTTTGGDSSITKGGVSVPIDVAAGGFGPPASSEYEIVDDVLRATFVHPVDGGVRTVEYTRVG